MPDVERILDGLAGDGTQLIAPHTGVKHVRVVGGDVDVRARPNSCVEVHSQAHAFFSAYLDGDTLTVLAWGHPREEEQDR